MHTYRADLHVHTVVSPCADVEMIPPLIVAEAVHQGIDIVAITDHNSTANIAAVQKAAQGFPLLIIPGMEVQTAEDVHVLCLFEKLEQALCWQELVDHHLPPLKNNPDFFGEQFIVDETGDFLTSEDRLLLTAADLSFEEAYQAVMALGGLFIPAHVNRKANGLLANLGFVPEDTPLDLLEISRHLSPADAKQQFPQIEKFPLIQNGDVHYLADFLGSLRLNMEYLSFQELRYALKNQLGRSFFIAQI
jgi:PHP family Zn ribbon phosphoesterase